MTDHETYVHPEKGLAIPRECRKFNGQVVIRTPTGTLTVNGLNGEFEPFFGMIVERHFRGPEDAEYDLQNPELAPDKATITERGGDPVELLVDTDPYNHQT